jgi:hypothetical protein
VSDTDIHIVKCNVLNAVQSQEIIALNERIKRLEVVERLATAQMDYIHQLETENDAMRADLLLWRDTEAK